MKGYKIHYRKSNYGWVNYDNVIYKDFNKCQEIRDDVKEQFPDYIFEIYEIEIND